MECNTAFVKYGKGALTTKANYSYGNGIVYFDPGAEFEVGNGDFTIESWMLFGTMGISSAPFLYQQYDPAKTYRGIRISYSKAFSTIKDHIDIQIANATDDGWVINTTSSQCTFGFTLLDGQYHHLAFVKESGNSTMYVDGNPVCTFSDAYDRSTALVSTEIGAIGGGLFMDTTQRADDFMISNVSRYSANFNDSLPAELVSDANTLLLINGE